MNASSLVAQAEPRAGLLVLLHPIGQVPALIICVDIVLAELPGRYLCGEHEIKLLVRAALCLRQSEESPY